MLVCVHPASLLPEPCQAAPEGDGESVQCGGLTQGTTGKVSRSTFLTSFVPPCFCLFFFLCFLLLLLNMKFQKILNTFFDTL